MADFGSKLRAAREKLGLTQEMLASMCGVERNAQGRYERGDRVPDVDYMQALVRLGIDVTSLLDEHGDAQRTTLTAEERQLVELYRRCDDTGRDAAKVAIAAMAQVSSVEPSMFFQLKVEDLPARPYAVQDRRAGYKTTPAKPTKG